VDPADLLGAMEAKGLEALVVGGALGVEKGPHRPVAEDGPVAQNVEKLHRK